MIILKVISERTMRDSMVHQSSVVDLNIFRAEREAGASFLPNPELLTQQFDITRREVTVRTKSMKATMVITEPLDTAIHLDQPAIIIAHGYMAAKGAYNDYAAELAGYGYRVAHGGMPRVDTKGEHLLLQNLRDPIVRHSKILHAYSKEIQRQYPDSPERHLFVGHSLGGYVISRFMEFSPESVEAAIALAGAGQKPHGFRQMASRALNAAKYEIAPFIANSPKEGQLEFALQSLYHIARSPITTILEGYHASKCDALTGIRHARNHNVPVGALWMTDDNFFPVSEADDAAKAEFNDWLIAKGNHMAPQEDMRYTAEQTLHLFSALRRAITVQQAQ